MCVYILYTVYVYVYICVYIHIYIYMHIHVDQWYSSSHHWDMNMYIYIYVYIFSTLYMCMYICVCIYMSISGTPPVITGHETAPGMRERERERERERDLLGASISRPLSLAYKNVFTHLCRSLLTLLLVSFDTCAYYVSSNHWA